MATRLEINGNQKDSTDNEAPIDNIFLLDGVNPLTSLRNLSDKLTNERSVVSKLSTVDLVEDGYLEIIQNGLQKTGVILEGAREYIQEFSDTIRTVNTTLHDVSDQLAKKLKEELNTDLSNGHTWSSNEASARKRESECQETVAKANVQISQVALLAAETERNTAQVATLVAMAQSRISKADESLKVSREQNKEETTSDTTDYNPDTQNSDNHNRENMEEKENIRKEEQMQTHKQRKYQEQEQLAIDRQKEFEEGEKEEFKRRQKEIADPRNWTDFVFRRKHHHDDQDEQDGVICVVRAPPEVFIQDETECNTLNQIHSHFRLGELEELVSDLVHLRALNSSKTFQLPVTVLVPHHAPRGVYGREIAVKVSRDGKNWTTVNAKDVALPNYKNRLAEIQLEDLNHVTIAVITRLKVDQEKFTRRGGKLTSSSDPRTILVIPKGAFRLPHTVHLKIQPIDSQTISKVKETTEGAHAILAASHLVFLDPSCSNMKPMTMWLPNPGVRKQKAKRPKTDQPAERRASNQPSLPDRRHSTPGAAMHAAEDPSLPQSLHLLLRTPDGQWTYKEDPDFETAKELVSFSIQEKAERVWLLRVQGELHHDVLIQTAEHLDEILRTVRVNFIVRQKSSDMSHVYVTCCRHDSTLNVLETLLEEGFDEGPDPSPEISISEGQVIEMCFRGNLTLDEREEDVRHPLKFVYNSHLNTCQHSMFIREIDNFAQHSLPYYRGHLQFYSKIERTNDGTTYDTDGETSKHADLLVELPVELPKPVYQHQKVNRAPIVIKEKGPLTTDYFQELCTDMGDEWRKIAAILGISRARVQAIIRQHLTAETCEPMIQDMLQSWFKNRPKNSDKVGELYWALRNAGREDLAMQLLERNKSHLAEIKRHEDEEKMKKAIKIIIGSPRINIEWKTFAKTLHVSDMDIDIVDNIPGATAREKCRQMLLRWHEEKKTKATRRFLAKVLRRCKYNDVADDIARFVGT